MAPKKYIAIYNPDIDYVTVGIEKGRQKSIFSRTPDILYLEDVVNIEADHHPEKKDPHIFEVIDQGTLGTKYFENTQKKPDLEFHVPRNEGKGKKHKGVYIFDLTKIISDLIGRHP